MIEMQTDRGHTLVMFQSMLPAGSEHYSEARKARRWFKPVSDEADCLMMYPAAQDAEKRKLENGPAFVSTDFDNQMMAGRREKARQGRWNGGQPPYGYVLENGELKIVPEAAEHIRMIYRIYLDGLGMASIANRLTDRDYRKVTYKNRKDATFSPHFVKGVLDNPVYMSKIAYGRRRTEKV